MIYAQLRENERTARYEVKVIPGNKCEPAVESAVASALGASASASSTPAKTRAKKTADGPLSTEWRIGQREEPCWVDLEAELRHMIARAPIDFGINSAEKSGAGAELMQRLTELTDDLYRIEAMESFMQYLSILNIFEYLRIVAALERVDANSAQASQVGIIGPEYFAQRKIALQLDLAEMTEWLVAHDIGLPDLAVFYPSRFGTEEVAVVATAAPKKKGRKKAGEPAEGEAVTEEVVTQSPIPEALRYVVELIRLQQATLYDLVKFVDDIKQRNNLETPREAIEMMQREAVAWLDTNHFQMIYESVKREEQLATLRQQAALERQRQVFEARPRRGAKGRRDDRNTRGGKLLKRHETSPLEEFTESMEEDSDEAYERAMSRALERPEGFEFMPDDLLGEDHGSGVAEDSEVENAPQEERPRRGRDNGRGRNQRGRGPKPVIEGEVAPEIAEGEAPSTDLFGDVDFDHDDDYRRDDHDDRDDRDDHDDHDDRERGDDQEMEGREPGEQREHPDGPRHQNDRNNDRRRRRTRGRRTGPRPDGPRHDGPRNDGPRRDGPRHDGPRHDGPRRDGPRHEGPRHEPREKPQGRNNNRRRSGGGSLDYDEVQPVSNYTPGLPASAQPGALPPPANSNRGGGAGGGAGKPKRRWRGGRR